jgi:predicted O-linked N-acetylglucosamine transferase (SPINDLY family)
MFDEAIKLYRHAIELDGSSYATVMNLAFLLQAEGFDAEAADQFARGMLLAPSMIEPAAGRAVSLARLGETKEAMALAADLYQRSPTHPRVHECLANLYEQQGRWAQAMEAWKEAVRLQPDSIRYRRTLAQRLLDGGARAEAADLCRQVLVDHPDDQPGAMMLASIEEQADCVVAARSIYQRLAKTGGDEALWKLREACAVPTILTEEGVIEECRQQIRDSLDQAAEADHCRSLDHLAAIGVMPPFNLAFHHRDDRALREKFAAWTSRLMGIEPSNGPQRSTRARPRIGFFCSGNPQAFCRSLHGILTRMDSGKLEAMVVTLPLIEPTLSQVFRGTSIPIVPLPSEPRRMIEAIRSMDLDLLIYFEVGTSPIGYLLAQHRLARVQVATWGIQITTGIASIDYYLSSDALEVEDSQKQYSEQLVRGRSLLTVMRRLPRWAGRIDRDQLGLPASGSIYLCPQQLGKFTPRFDLVLSQILRQDVTGYVVITEGNIPELTSRLRERWRRTISDVSDRIVFVPQAQGESYLALIAASDVVLDPIDFGGVNTTYDVFSQNKVLVTLPSCFQRTRYAAACYGRMGIDEAIATSIDDYVAKAVHFATVSDARQSLEKRLRERTDGIFMQVDAAADVERILLALAHGDGPW